MRFGLAGWSRASGLVKLGCVWAGPYMCGPESRGHAGRVVGLTRLLCADRARWRGTEALFFFLKYYLLHFLKAIN